MTTTHRHRRAALAFVVAITAALGASACSPSPGTTTRISVLSSGTQLDGQSSDAAVSPDGRFVVFSSRADIPGFGDANDATLWLKDREDGALHRVSFPALGQDDPGGSSEEPSIARSGAIAFASSETDLVMARDANGRNDDVFLRDERNVMHLVSVALDGESGNQTSRDPSVSADGRVVAFQSSASDLVTGDTNGRVDIFVRDIRAGTTRRASLSRTGSQLSVDSTDPAISADGRRVAFLTSATLSAADRDAETDVYVKDLLTGAVTFASIEGIGEDVAHELDMSEDGRFVAFVSTVPGGTLHAFVRDLVTGQATLISHRAGSTARGNGSTTRVAISADGTHVAFSSRASDLVVGDTNGHDDYFVARRDGSDVRRVSVRTDGGQSRGHSATPDVSDDGKVAVFMSAAPDLVSGDTNEDFDVFAHERR